MRGVSCGTLYKLFGRILIDGCNSFIVPKSKAEECKILDVFGGDIML